MQRIGWHKQSRCAGATAITVFSLATCLASPKAIAADPAEYKPPGDYYSMRAHFHWCGEAATPAAKVKRYEKFWELQAPDERDGYDDSPHVRTVRRCAYRLAELYARLGRQKDCLKMLRWLEKEDDSFNIEGSG